MKLLLLALEDEILEFNVGAAPVSSATVAESHPVIVSGVPFGITVSRRDDWNSIDSPSVCPQVCVFVEAVLELIRCPTVSWATG